MKVYVLMNYRGDQYEGDTNLVSVYSTMEKAENAKLQEEKQGDRYDKFWIEKEELK